MVFGVGVAQSVTVIGNVHEHSARPGIVAQKLGGALKKPEALTPAQPSPLHHRVVGVKL